MTTLLHYLPTSTSPHGPICLSTRTCSSSSWELHTLPVYVLLMSSVLLMLTAGPFSTTRLSCLLLMALVL
ncbi:hypothetical protein NA56DRAFT_647758 [Hyaloscypha hepaticicola]|uniref:Uncharacterized protein n=1 Tax=Hyaloscypha hepaticicola TaxID=2082293 RepID=A0A2J6PWW0_9HELO|nr:hypothetical protein NA56DRAFT_647758 [Hyaloscypha hepaticicola]